jgi:hypothetical protein
VLRDDAHTAVCVEGALFGNGGPTGVVAARQISPRQAASLIG